MEDEIKKLKEALEFYSIESNYGYTADNGYTCSCCRHEWYEEGEVELDRGKKAREALGLE